MAMPGPKPMPTAVKVARGNPGKRPLNTREPEPRLLERLPPTPAEFSERAAKAWTIVGRELIAVGLLTVLGLPALRRWAIAFETYEKSRELIERTGIVLMAKNGTGAYLNPAVGAQSMASKELGKIEAEFGMTPASASRVRAANTKQLDLFAEIFESGDGADYSLPDDEMMN